MSAGGKRELMDALREAGVSSDSEARRMVDVLLKAIRETTYEKDMLVLRGFGTFRVHRRRESTTRNPRTGWPMKIPAPGVHGLQRIKDQVMGQFAKDTKVSVANSKAEIERTLERYGAAQFMSGWTEDKAVIGFAMNDRQIRFILQMPERNDRNSRITLAGDAPIRRRTTHGNRHADNAGGRSTLSSRQSSRRLRAVFPNSKTNSWPIS